MNTELKELGKVYFSDYLFIHNPNLHDQLCQKHFGDKGQDWRLREHSKIQDFLREYYDQPNLVLMSIKQSYSPHSGFPIWAFYCN